MITGLTVVVVILCVWVFAFSTEAINRINKGEENLALNRYSIEGHEILLKHMDANLKNLNIHHSMGISPIPDAKNPHEPKTLEDIVEDC